MNSHSETQNNRHGDGLPGGSETILVVEDQTDLRTLAVYLLRSCGFEVLSAESGAAALVHWEKTEGRIDLVLTDILMPEMTGFELVARIQNERPGIKVIFTSGREGAEFSGGPDLVVGSNFIPKPYTLLKLAQAVRDRLDGP